MRTDIGMSQGKAIAQAGHAYVQSILACLVSDPERERLYHSDGIGTKVCLGVPSEQALLRTYHAAKAAGLPCYLIEDSGHMSFHEGKPILTALGIGPATRAETRKLTSGYKLLP